MENKIVMIKTEHLHPHPDNPRKDLGDLSELTESIKKNGIMQNLTVVPAEEPGEYMVVIGHRRTAAAKAAGLTELPCVIRDLEPRQQFAVMLEENMQRADLTVPEQAYGFQLMFDWGNSVEDIAKKTGFSETTVRHRLELAKLDKNLLARRQQEKNEYMQLGINDLIKLEKIKSIAKRNEILQLARDSSDLDNRVKNYLKEMAQKENAKLIIGILKKAGIQEAPESLKNNRWSSKYDRPEWISLTLENCKEVTEKIVEKLKKEKKTFWYLQEYSSVQIYTLAKKQKKEETEYDRIEKQGKKLRQAMKDAYNFRKSFVKDIVLDRTRKPEGDFILECWDLIKDSSNYFRSAAADVLFNAQYGWYSLDEKQKKALDVLDMWQEMLVVAEQDMSHKEIFRYPLKFDQDVAAEIAKYTDLLNEYFVFEWPEEYKSIFDGTHELYRKE